ncbi:hypothetical protein [Verminephrobacter aporrectodeae]|uniref:hypothetical protein n=1 Tax=Verminephrobacter aporrectodeae TaxID=1110389 RepID=UPI001F1E1282|nr:hypothetical protein [Verminephrobacter aporrectodeae]
MKPLSWIAKNAIPVSNSHSGRSAPCRCAGFSARGTPDFSGASSSMRIDAAENKSSRLLAKLAAIPKNTNPVPERAIKMPASAFPTKTPHCRAVCESRAEVPASSIPATVNCPIKVSMHCWLMKLMHVSPAATAIRVPRFDEPPAIPSKMVATAPAILGPMIMRKGCCSTARRIGGNSSCAKNGTIFMMHRTTPIKRGDWPMRALVQSSVTVIMPSPTMVRDSRVTKIARGAFRILAIRQSPTGQQNAPTP